MHPEWGRPALCLVTDRRRLVAALAEAQTAWQSLLLKQVEGAIAGGIDVVQIRENDLDARVLARLVRQCLALAAGTTTRIVVNDRIDVALATNADGVHLREDGPLATVARGLMPSPAIVGRSIHAPAAASVAGPVDYLIAGTIFETASKPESWAPLGLTGLRSVVEQAGDCPVWAIGGMTAERIPLVSRAGARGAAAIGAFIPSCSAAELATAVQKVTALLRFYFDSSVGVP